VSSRPGSGPLLEQAHAQYSLLVPVNTRIALSYQVVGNSEVEVVPQESPTDG
jgi:hypothetical protein